MLSPWWITNSPELLNKAQQLASEAGVTTADGIAYLANLLIENRDDPRHHKVHPELCPAYATARQRFQRSYSAPVTPDASIVPGGRWEGMARAISLPAKMDSGHSSGEDSGQDSRRANDKEVKRRESEGRSARTDGRGGGDEGWFARLRKPKA